LCGRFVQKKFHAQAKFFLNTAYFSKRCGFSVKKIDNYVAESLRLTPGLQNDENKASPVSRLAIHWRQLG